MHDGLASQVGQVPGIRLVTWLYDPVPPTEVYLRPVSAPDVELGVTMFCALAAHSNAASETNEAERRMVE